MADVFRSLCADFVRVADALDGGKSSFANQGQALDGFSALANFLALADVVRKELAKPESEPPTLDCDEVEVPAYHRGDAFFVYKEGYAAGCGAGIAAAIESEQLNPWKAELIDALVCSHILQEEHYSNPRKALNDLIAWDIQVATDPRVSSTALQKPKPFNEEPPTADDADEEGVVWGLDAHLTWKRTHWRLIGRYGYSYWLPLWALPLPTKESPPFTAGRKSRKPMAADPVYYLSIYIHAHKTGNSVPPHIEAEAIAALKDRAPQPTTMSGFLATKEAVEGYLRDTGPQSEQV